MTDAIEETLRRYNVVYDTWSSEQSLHDSGAVDRALADAREAGVVYESEERPGSGPPSTAMTRTAS